MQKISSENVQFDLSLIDPAQTPSIVALGKMLSHPKRIEIIQAIQSNHTTLSQIAEHVGLSTAHALFHLNLIEECGYVSSEVIPGSKGNAKRYRCTWLAINLNMRAKTFCTRTVTYEQSERIGNYRDASFSDLFAFFVGDKMIRAGEDVFCTERHDATQLFTNRFGYVEYDFSALFARTITLHDLSFSAELCAEATFFHAPYKSDLTFFVNGIELGTYTCPGDFGERKGRVSTHADPLSTKYGQLVTVSVRRDGAYINEVCTSPDVTLELLQLTRRNRVTFRIECKKNARHCGGFNLFGATCGDFAQDIVMRAEGEEATTD